MKVRTLLRHMATSVDEVEIWSKSGALSCGKSSLETLRDCYAECKVEYFDITRTETGMTVLEICVKDTDRVTL